MKVNARRDAAQVRRWLRWHFLLIAGLTLGAAIDHWLPEARSLPHAVHLLRTATP